MPKSAPPRARTGKRNVGISGAGAISFTELVFPAEAYGAPLAGKLIVLKRCKLKFLDLLNQLLLLVLGKKTIMVNESIRNLRRAIKEIQAFICSGHNIIMPRPAKS
jgi:hypothetical protein